MFKLLLITFIFISLSFVGIAVRVLMKKNGKMAGTCASQSPFLNKNGENCSFCGKPSHDCKKKNLTVQT